MLKCERALRRLIHCKFLALVLPFARPLLNIRSKPLKVRIHRCNAGWPRQIKRSAIAEWRNFDPRYDAIVRRNNGQSLPSLGLKIQTGVEVIFPQLAKISRQNQRNVQRRNQPIALPMPSSPILLRLCALLHSHNTESQEEGHPQTKTEVLNVHQHEGCKTNIGTQRERL